MSNKPNHSKGYTSTKSGKKGKSLSSSIIVGAIVFVFFSLVGSAFALIPPPATVNRFITVVSLSLIIGVSGVWNRVRPSWIAQGILVLGINTLLLAWAIHCLSFGVLGINNLFWLAPLVIAYLIAWILPLLDLPLAKVISDEQLGPNTRLGRGCIAVVLSIGGAGGAIGAIVGRYTYEAGGFQPVMLILGIAVSILSVGLAQTFAYQLHALRLRESKAEQQVDEGGG